MDARIERIGSAEVEVEVLPELGARLHRLRAFGRDLLRTPAELASYRLQPFLWGAYVMAPWCNRLPANPIEVGGRMVDLPANFPDGTAIHGQVQALPWEMAAPAMFRVAAGGEGWPWRYEATLAIAVDGPRLRLDLGLTNRSSDPMPAGIGIHPWFQRPLEVAIAAASVFTSNSASAPRPQPVSGRHDLRRMGQMPFELDATWSDLSGTDPIELRWPAAGVSGTIRVSPEGAYLCAASPAMPAAVAIEPQTHAPDGLRRLVRGEPGALRALAPGERLNLSVDVVLALIQPDR